MFGVVIFTPQYTATLETGSVQRSHSSAASKLLSFYAHITLAAQSKPYGWNEKYLLGTTTEVVIGIDALWMRLPYVREPHCI